MASDPNLESPFGPVIFSYSRAEALSDGVLIDVSSLAREAGFLWPVAVTDHLYSAYLVPPRPLLEAGQSFTGRLWDVLSVLRFAIKTSSPSSRELRFSVYFLMSPVSPPVPIDILSVSGPDDDGSPCLTIMLPEDL